MSRLTKHGWNSHLLREIQTKHRRIDKGRKSKRQDYPTSTVLYEQPNKDFHALFYGRKPWYDSLSVLMRLDCKKSYTEMGELPANLDSIDIIIIDGIKEGGEFKAASFMNLVKEQTNIEVCLSYKEGWDTNGFSGKMFSFLESDNMHAYINKKMQLKYFKRINVE